MKIVSVKSLAIPEIQVIRFARFRDHRGYFSESFRQGVIRTAPELSFLKQVSFVQAIESYSYKHTIRGLHFQWNPYMGKLVRTVSGSMIDLVLDIRKDSPTLGKIIAYELPYDPEANEAEWIWIPPGFAHGNFYLQDSMIEYFCSGEYSPGCEAGICPLASDLDWSLCEPIWRKQFERIAAHSLISDKDRLAPSLSQWLDDPRSAHFIYPLSKVEV